jgi:hypothetical protein
MDLKIFIQPIQPIENIEKTARLLLTIVSQKNIFLHQHNYIETNPERPLKTSKSKSIALQIFICFRII